MCLFPDAYHVISQVGKGEDERNDQQGLILVPSYGLLVPESGNDAQYRKHESQYVQHHVAFPVQAMRLQFAVLAAVAGIDIQSDEHPEYQAYPGICRKEAHHAEADEDSHDGGEGDKGDLETPFYSGHGLADNQYGGAYQGKGQQGTDAGHFSGYLGGDEACQQTYHYHEEQVAVHGGVEPGTDAGEKGWQQAVVAHAQEDAALSHQSDHNDGAISEKNGQDDGSVEI